MNKTTLTTLILSLLLPVASNADMLLYEFGGVLPNGSSNHLQVQDGESFTSSFLFDSLAIDDFPSQPQFGVYEALSGNIEFSGGYFLELMLNAPAVGIFDDVDLGALVDIVTVQDIEGGSFRVAVVTEDTNALSGDGAGFASSTSDPQLNGSIQLLFNDGANGSISYNVGPGTTNTFFNVRSVPEPSSGLLFCVGVSLALTRRIR